MKILELSTKEYEELYKKGLVEEEKRIIEDDDDLELLPEDELQQIEGLDKKKHNIALDWNFRVLKDKINELAKEINEIRKNK